MLIYLKQLALKFFLPFYSSDYHPIGLAFSSAIEHLIEHDVIMQAIYTIPLIKCAFHHASHVGMCNLSFYFITLICVCVNTQMIFNTNALFQKMYRQRNNIRLPFYSTILYLCKETVVIYIIIVFCS